GFFPSASHARHWAAFSLADFRLRSG
ncbi:hypothetical protein ECNE1487_2848, partial [Escherichia coli NE1487]